MNLPTQTAKWIASYSNDIENYNKYLPAIEKTISRIRQMVYIEITNHQVMALTSIGWDIGTGLLARSEMMIALNCGRVAEAADLILGLGGVRQRRVLERELFVMPDVES